MWGLRGWSSLCRESHREEPREKMAQTVEGKDFPGVGGARPGLSEGRGGMVRRLCPATLNFGSTASST